MTNPDNAGLDKPINRLNPLVQQFANEGTGLSRADVWAVAAVLGVDVADHGIHNNPIFFVMNSIGRQDCEVANKVCLDASGKQVHCGALHGPHRVAPTMNLNTSVSINNEHSRKFIKIISSHRPQPPLSFSVYRVSSATWRLILILISVRLWLP